MSHRPRMDGGIRISRRMTAIGGALVIVLLAVVAIVAVAQVLRANEPVVVATAAQLKVQQGAAERDVERAYEQATEQVRKVRALSLAISASQADQIAGKALADLKTLRHSAFVSLGLAQGMTNADAESYAAMTESRFDQVPASKMPSPSPVLLAPRFYTIVSRMSELATQLADQATNALTASPPTPSPTARPSASPSPTR